MGSPKTRPTIAQRWPRNAESQRRRAAEATQDARELLDEARGHLRSNPLLAEVMMADAMALLADIQRELVEARIGVEPSDGGAG